MTTAGTCVLVCLLGGCIGDPTVVCRELACPSGNVCTPHGCATRDEAAACADKQDGEPCSTPAYEVGGCAGQACHPVVCGDAIQDRGEACDDGNTLAADGCSATCDSNETCGNGVVDVIDGEQCDDGTLDRSADGCSSRCATEVSSWSDVTPQSIPGRAGLGLAFDSDRNRAVVFGGYSTSGILGDTWEWDGILWRRREPVTSPPQRSEPCLVYDAARHVTLLFGGSTDDGPQNDTWTWDGTSWIQLQPPMSPPKARDVEMVYDSIRDKAVLMLATTGSVPVIETWEWDGTTWTEQVPAVSPPARFAATVAFDAGRGVTMYALGGQTGDNDDVWEWNGTSWSSHTPATQPRPYAFAAAGYDPVRQRVVLFGGIDDNGLLSADVWEYDGNDWTDRSPLTPFPGRTDFAMTYDTASHAVLAVGGYHFNGSDPVDVRSDSAEWNGTAWSMYTSPRLQPVPRGFHTLAYDRRHGEVIMFGGWTNQGYFADTWKWTDGRWEQQVPAVSPPARGDHAMVYDGDRDRIVMFGGESSFNVPRNDAWEWTASTGWAPLATTGPPAPAREDFGMAYDTVRKRVVLFGGTTAPVDNRTWELDGATWSAVSTSTTPAARSNQVMAFDERRGTTVMFGGRIAGEETDETWEYDGTDWTQMHPAVSPPARSFAIGAYDPQRGTVVIGAGNNFAGIVVGDFWEWDGMTWARIDTAVVPSVRYASALIYDDIERRMLLTTGFNYFGDSLDDTWALSYGTPIDPVERCVSASDDRDGDGAVGCADPDCWGRCDPLCPPGANPVPCPADRSRCGDGICDPVEDHPLCPDDCP